jgi:hypothetical protein
LKAHYIIIQSQGTQMPLLFPVAEGDCAKSLARGFHAVSGGQCELLNGQWSAAGELDVGGSVIRSRQTHDAEHLRRHFGDGTLVAGIPFTTRPALDL